MELQQLINATITELDSARRHVATLLQRSDIVINPVYEEKKHIRDLENTLIDLLNDARNQTLSAPHIISPKQAADPLF